MWIDNIDHDQGFCLSPAWHDAQVNQCHRAMRLTGKQPVTNYDLHTQLGNFFYPNRGAMQSNATQKKVILVSKASCFKFPKHYWYQKWQADRIGQGL
jgi:hypothetical protein